MLLQSLATACALVGLRGRAPAVTEATSFTENPGWPSVETLLDTVPVFTIANENEKPLEYQVDGQPMAMFYADVEAAKTAFESANS